MAASAAGQSFEVASIKPTPPPGPENRMIVSVRGGPGTDDPTRAVFNNLDLINLVTLAFATDDNLVTAPDWARSERFIIEARVPEGATREQFFAMLKSLLIERFHLTFHYEKKEVAMYDLVVAKNGPKFKETTPAAESARPDGPAQRQRTGPLEVDQDGFPILPGGRGMASARGHARVHQPEETMDQLAQMISGQVKSPVTNATALAGKFDISLYWVSRNLRAATGDDDAGPSIFEALQEQLGLRLQAKKGMVDFLVVDHMDKTPTEN